MLINGFKAAGSDAQTTVLLMSFRDIYFFGTNKQQPAYLTCSFIVNLLN